MAQTWTIFVSGQPTVERAVVHELEYHGSWMEEEYVSVNVRSATPITFQYGDHLYYRGTKFEINYDPNFIKKARSGSYGEGFTYDNIKLYPVSVKLKDIAFKDVVLNDPSAPANTLVYSSLGTFSFFAGSVEDLADRIQANLNRDYNGEWRVYTPYKVRNIQRNGNIGAWGQYYNGDGSTIQGKTDINIECQNLSVMDALKMAYTSFDLSFYVTGKVIVIGGKPISADYDFEYGKGNGLYEIERTHDDSQRIVTKLFAYGSDKNLPLNYYANIGKRIKVQIAHKTKREITMGNPELVLWVNKEFTKALRDAFSPTYEVKLTLGHLSARFGVCGNTYTYAEEQDDDTLDHTTEYMTFWALSSDANALAMYNILVSGSQLYVTGVNINEMPADFIETPTSYNYDAALSITKLMLPGFPTQSLFAWVVANGATHINYQTGQARWHGYDAIFSTDKSDPWIKSINAGNIGVREGTVEFDSSSDKEIFPTIEGTGFDEVAWCEQIEDNGHIDKELTFALQPMTVDGSDGDIEWDYGGVSISMKDGYCTGREFEVAEAKLNDNGDWELTMKRKKDDSLGVYFPYKSGSGNLYQIMGRGNHHGQMDGDHFVILGIPLPQSYVENAAAMLLEEALKHLAKVDHQSYTYLPRIDEIEMARQHDRAMASQGTITSIHDTICAGMQMQIDDDDLNVHYSPFIDNITIKENGNNGIPTYDVVLKDEKEMTMQERIQSQIDGGKDAIINSLSPEGEWLSKVSDDTAQGMITFLRGLQVGERFVTGLLGEGGVFRVEDDGTTYIEADKLYIRMKAYFDSVEIREYHHTGGNRIASVAGARCCRVEWIDSQGNVLEKTQANLSSVVKFRCYFMGNDGEDEVRNNWVVGDLAYCHITTVETEQSDNPEAKGLNMRHYWRKVVGRNATGTLTVKGEHWIDLSNVSGEYQSGSDVPVAQDDIIQLGNVSDGDRQGAIIEFVTGANAPSYQIFQHINSFSLNEKNFVNLGYDSQNNTAQAFIGNPDKSTYLWYHNVTVGGQTFPRLEIKANVQFTSPETSYGTQDLNAFISAVTGDINNIHSQIDGTIETWFYDGEPTLNNLPASQWTSSTDKDKHLGDLYYDNQTGYGYRFAYDESVTPAVYKWIKITDVDVVKALADAAKAQDTADHKRRVFVAQPAPVSPKNYVEYDIGDLWVNATNPSGYTGETDEANHKYNNDCLRCITAKPIRNEQGQITDGNFSINDWQLASKYTDDTELRNFLGDYEGTAEDLKQQIDKKAETWYQDEDPSLDWYVVNPQTQEVITDVRSEHVGDLWYCTAPVSATPPSYYDAVHGGNKTWQYKYNESTSNYYWAYQNVPVAVFDRIDGKAQLFVQIPNVANPKDDGYCYRKDDMWILESDNIHSPEMAGELMVATQSSTSYNSTHWIKKLKYTDDLDNFKLNQYVLALTSGNITQDITNASNAAQQAKQAADDAQADADAANTRLTNWADDGKISPTEKLALKNQKADVEKEYAQIIVDAGKYNVNTANFTTAYNKAITAFNYYTSSSTEDIPILNNATDTDVAPNYSRIADYYAARQTILNNIATASKTYAEDLASSASVNYLNDAARTAIVNALGGATVVDGGLLLTSLIAMRKYDGTGDKTDIANYTTWAGISGMYDDTPEGQGGAKGHGIAAWYGGGMIDHEASPNTANYAKSLFRFDGTGYLAGGNLTWDTNGTLKIGKTTNSYNIQLNSDGSGSVAAGNISWTTGGVLTIQGNSIAAATELKVAGSDVLTQTTADARYVTIDWFRSLFRAYNSSDTELTPNNSTTGLDSIKAMVGFWTESYISALGQSSGGGSGISLNEPLLSINQAGLSAPTTNGSVLVYSSGWKYSYNAAIVTSGLTSTGSVSANGFYVTGKNDTYVVLAGGGTKLLSEIGGSGSVVSVSINGTSYSPDANGDVNLGSGYLTGYTDTKTTAGISQSSSKLYIIGSTNTSATAGSYGTTYTNTNCYIGTDGCLYSNSNKVLTSISSSDVTTALGFTPSSSDTLNTTGSTNNTGQTMYLVGALQQATSTVTYTNSGVYVDASNWLNASVCYANYFAFKGNSGRVGYIGKGSSGRDDIQIIADTGALEFKAGGGAATTSDLIITANHDVGIGKASASYKLDVNGSVYASSFVKSSGTSSQFLKADGSVDSTSYASQTWAQSNCLPKLAWWNAEDTHNVDSLSSGITFAYSAEHNAPTTGTIVAFSSTTNTYQLQLQGGYYSNLLYFRNRDADNTTWGSWREIIHSGNIASQSVASASTANKLSTARSIWGASFDGSADIPINTAAAMSYVLFRNRAYNAYAGHCGRGGSASDALQLCGYSGNGIDISGGYINMKTDGGTSDLYINSSHNVGIGTDSPTFKFHVNGVIKASGLKTGAICIEVNSTGSTTNRGSEINNYDAALYLQHNSSKDVVMVGGGGKVGIGVSSPSYKLDVVGNVQFGENSTYKVRIGSTNNAASISMVGSDGTSRGVFNLASNSLNIGVGSASAGYTTVLKGNTIELQYGSSGSNVAIGVDSSGNVGIGTASPSYKLDVVGVSKSNYMMFRSSTGGNAGYIGRGSNANNNIQVIAYSGNEMVLGANGSNIVYITTGGNVGIGTSYPSYKLHVAGDIYATGGVTALSDAREKNIIGNTMLTVEDIAMMKAVNYRWKDGRDNVQHVGSIAQDWQRVLPEVVMRADDEKGTLSLQYGVAALVSSIVTARKVVDHERRIAELERENRELKEKLKIA